MSWPLARTVPKYCSLAALRASGRWCKPYEQKTADDARSSYYPADTMGQVLLRLTNWVNGLFLSHTNLSSQGKDNPAGVIQKIRGARSPAGAGVFHRRRKKATYTGLKICVMNDLGCTNMRIASLSDQPVVSVFNWTEIG